MDPGGSEPRSPVWGAVAEVTERSHRRHAAFDPENATPADCVDEIEPIVRLYAKARSEGVQLSAVERSLLDGVLNDWLRSYAVCRGLPAFDGSPFSVHEVTTRVAEAGDVTRGVETLFDR